MCHAILHITAGEAKVLDMSPERLGPVKSTPTQLYIREHVLHSIPHSNLKVHDGCSESGSGGEMSLETPQHCRVVLLWLPAHYDVHQRHLFHTVPLCNESMYAPELCEWGPDALKGRINVLFLGWTQEHHHQGSEKDQVTTVVYLDVFFEEVLGDGVVFHLKVNCCWISWSGSLTALVCLAD